MNKVILIGRPVKDPELKYTQNNKTYCQFTLAINRPFKNAQGENQADFINCVSWGKTAEVIAQYIRKGTQFAVEGSIQVSKYTNQQGETKYQTQVVCERMEFLARAENQQQNTQMNNSYQKPDNPLETKEENNPFEGMDYEVKVDDLPF